jgi:heat shock protein HtpX
MKNNLKTAVLLAGIGGLLIAVGGAFGGQSGAADRSGDRPRVHRRLVLVQRQARHPLGPGRRGVRAADAPSTTPSCVTWRRRPTSRCPASTWHADPSPTPSPPGATPSTPRCASTRASSTPHLGGDPGRARPRDQPRPQPRHPHRARSPPPSPWGSRSLARMAMWGAMFGGGSRDRNDNVLGTLALVILAPLAAGLLQMALSRSREYEADRRGAPAHRLRRTARPGAREARPRHAAWCPVERRPGAGRGLHRQPVQRAATPVRQAVHHPPAHGRPHRPPPRRRLAVIARP